MIISIPLNWIIYQHRTVFSSGGVAKLESDIHFILNVVKTTPAQEEPVLSTPVILNLRFTEILSFLVQA